MRTNQASLARLPDAAFGVFGENRFELAETSCYTAIFGIPTETANFALQADYFGSKNFNESQLGIAIARPVGDNFDLGIKFNHYASRIPGYGSLSAFTFELGAVMHLTAQLHSGIHIYNPVGGVLSKNTKEKLPSAYSFGLGYEPSAQFLISVNIVKEENKPVNIDAVGEYNFAKQFFARIGISSGTSTPFGGAGWAWNNFRVDLAASWHPQLGLSSGMMLLVNLQQRKSDDQ